MTVRDSTAPARSLEGAEAAEAIVAIMAANGVSELFVMPGDAFPVLEAATRMRESGRPAPRIVTCLHEVVALAAAHGHFMVSGRPQACLFHVDVGLQMAGGMLHNAQRGRAGVVIFAGRTPMTWDGSMRGGRVVDVHWMQDRRDQGGGARDYVKWQYDLSRTENLPAVVQRAFQVAASEPAGPVYVSLLREMLMEPMGAGELPDPARFAPPRAPVPAAGDLERVAELIASAERPLAISGHTGRTAAGFHALTEFAETAAVPVVTRAGRANLNSDSPMHAGASPGPHLAGADLILLLDVDVPYIPLFGPPDPEAEVIQIDVDPLKAEIPVWGFPVDLALQGDTAVALPVLTELLRERRSADVDERARRLAAAADERRRELVEAAEAKAGESPIAVDFVAHCVAELVDDETIVVDDSTTALAVTSEHMPTRVPGSYFQPQGSSMGWGAGAALGAKLAAPERTVINLNAEGNLLSGVPEPALWAARRYDAPFLTIVFNNGRYAAIELGLTHEYPDSRLAASGEALTVPDGPDLTDIAHSCGAHAARVTEPSELRAALRNGLDAVRGGQAALVDVAVAAP